MALLRLGCGGKKFRCKGELDAVVCSSWQDKRQPPFLSSTEDKGAKFKIGWRLISEQLLIVSKELSG